MRDRVNMVQKLAGACPIKLTPEALARLRLTSVNAAWQNRKEVVPLLKDGAKVLDVVSAARLPEGADLLRLKYGYGSDESNRDIPGELQNAKDVSQSVVNFLNNPIFQAGAVEGGKIAFEATAPHAGNALRQHMSSFLRKVDHQ